MVSGSASFYFKVLLSSLTLLVTARACPIRSGFIKLELRFRLIYGFVVLDWNILGNKISTPNY